jgi:hypothetical protein
LEVPEVPEMSKSNGTVKPGLRFVTLSEQVNAPAHRPSSALAQTAVLAKVARTKLATFSFERSMLALIIVDMVIIINS